VRDAARELDVKELVLAHPEQELRLGVLGQALELGRPSQDVALPTTRKSIIKLIFNTIQKI
jgi:hypothetical protein